MFAATMRNVFWLQQTEADVPAENDWLCGAEKLRLNRIRFPKRRADWRLGRWTGKCACAAYLGRSAQARFLSEIEIRPALSGAPEVFVGDRAEAAAISLSHRAGTAMVAISAPGIALGCDLEIAEPRSDAFIADYFTLEEQLLLALAPAADRLALVALLWSAKESALKALHEGLRLDTRSVVVNLGEHPQISRDTAHNSSAPGLPTWSQAASNRSQNGWQAFQVRCISCDHTLHGWWQCAGSLVRTVVADAPLLPPLSMNPFSRQTE
ncbi:MAG: 4'-phosphopantetheinyl transferase family protein [Chlamydiota bacterium]